MTSNLNPSQFSQHILDDVDWEGTGMEPMGPRAMRVGNAVLPAVGSAIYQSMEAQDHPNAIAEERGFHIPMENGAIGGILHRRRPEGATPWKPYHAWATLGSQGAHPEYNDTHRQYDTAEEAVDHIRRMSTRKNYYQRDDPGTM